MALVTIPGDPETLTEEQRARGKITQLERRQLGKEGKLWCVQVSGHVGPRLRTYRKENLTEGELFRLRKDIFAAGVMVPAYLDDPGEWVIIPPLCLDPIYCTKQSKFFEP